MAYVKKAFTSHTGMNKPVSVLRLESVGPVTIRRPRQLSAMTDGSVLVADMCLPYINRIDVNGQILARYYWKGEKTNIISVAAKNGNIFGLSEDRTTIMHIKPDHMVETFCPAFTDLNTYSLATDGENVLCGQLDSNGVICYNVKTRETKKIIAGITARDLQVELLDGSYKCIASDYDAGKVYIFDMEGRFYSQFDTFSGGLQNPEGVTLIENGNLLVVDYAKHRICEYQTNGNFVGHLLTSDDGIGFPCGIACRYPYLWVSESYRNRNLEDLGNVKLFKYGL